MSFSLDFPDEAIFAALGDTVDIISIETGQVLATVNGEFKSEHKEDEYGNTIDMVIDVFEIPASQRSWFNMRLHYVVFNGKTYNIEKVLRMDSQLYKVILNQDTD